MSDHRIPAVDRAIQLLDCLARAARPLGVRELATELVVPRSTVYRLCNSLEAGQLVTKAGEQTYVLGPAIKRLAQAVPQGFDLVSLARPTLSAMATDLQLSVKLSVLDQGNALVVLSAPAPTAYVVSTQVGRRFPLHAGAASKVLAAHLDADALADALPHKLERHTTQTITSKAKLKTELAAVRLAGYACDRGEFANGVEAIGAPVFGPDGNCVAALSVPFFMDEEQGRRERVLQRVRSGARKISAELGAPHGPTAPGSDK
jgi:DNA-binding IclR family transcriptional regulator